MDGHIVICNCRNKRNKSMTLKKNCTAFSLPAIVWTISLLIVSVGFYNHYIFSKYYLKDWMMSEWWSHRIFGLCVIFISYLWQSVHHLCQSPQQHEDLQYWWEQKHMDFIPNAPNPWLNTYSSEVGFYLVYSHI